MSNVLKPHAYLFADGSASKGNDIGAYAAIAATRRERKVVWGVEFPSTITRCELLPIIGGLHWIRQNWTASRSRGFRVSVYSDSEYTVKVLSGCLERRKHLDLYARLDAAVGRMIVSYTWRERNSLPYMTFCDAICGSARRTMINSMKKINPDNPRAIEDVMPYGTLPDDIEPIDIPKTESRRIQHEDRFERRLAIGL
jgi:ribonuclease HI